MKAPTIVLTISGSDSSGARVAIWQKARRALRCPKGCTSDTDMGRCGIFNARCDKYQLFCILECTFLPIFVA